MVKLKLALTYMAYNYLKCTKYKKSKYNCEMPQPQTTDQSTTGADPGFLERGFICINVWGFALLSLSHFILNIS